MTRVTLQHERGPQRLPMAEAPGGAVWLCRCGLSAKMPYCDSSHKATLDEAAEGLYAYERRDGVLARREVRVA